MNNSIVLSQKALSGELFYLFFWERVFFTPKTNEVWFIEARYEAGEGVIKVHPFESIGKLGKPILTRTIWESSEPEMRSSFPWDYGRCFYRHLKAIIEEIENPKIDTSHMKPEHQDSPAINIVDKMCAESLSPDTHNKWEEVKLALLTTRPASPNDKGYPH